MKKLIFLFVFVALIFNLQADWDPIDGYKMHYPQLPDPTGYDVLCMEGLEIIGDDWQCTATGEICDIHFWISMQEDEQGIPPQSIMNIRASIYSDSPAGNPDPYSHPDIPLW
jgi:hypothetical protein